MTERTLARVSVLVPSYQAGIDFYVGTLGFHLEENADLGGGRKWIVVQPGAGREGASLVLAKAENERQRARIGDQTGGRVGFFLFTSNFADDYGRLTAAGVHFLENPRHEAYGTVAIFVDPFGNKWDLIESV